MKNKLLELQQSLKAEKTAAKTTAKPVELDQQAVGRVSRIDAIQQQQMHAASLRRLEQRLELVEATLKIVDTEEYGLCAVCEEPIALKRLEARPESRICIQCANRN